MRKRHFTIIISLVLMLCLFGGGCTSKEARIKREYEKTETREMQLAVWAPPYSEVYETEGAMDKVYRMLAESGINYVYNEQEWDSELLNRIMDCCEKYGIKSIIGLPTGDKEWAMSVVRQTMEHPACWGYNLRDEPAIEEIEYLTDLGRTIRNEAPSHIRLTLNLLPNYNFTWEGFENIDLDAYSTYVRDAAGFIQPDSLSFDYYPIRGNMVIEDHIFVYYLKNLLEIKERCEQAEVMPLSIVQCSTWSGMKQPTDKELEFLVNVNLVSGMKGVTYYLYWSHIDYETGETTIDGMMSYEGEPNPIYYSVQRINQGLGKMKGVFLDYSQEGYIFTNMPGVYHNFYGDITDKEILRYSYGPVSSVESAACVLSGCFTKEDGSKALYVMNYYLGGEEAQEVKLNFTQQTSYKVWNFDGLTDMDKGTELILNLAPGEAAFVELN